MIQKQAEQFWKLAVEFGRTDTRMIEFKQQRRITGELGLVSLAQVADKVQEFSGLLAVLDDRMWDRILFSVRDPLGTIIGFSGRTLEKDSQFKYLQASILDGFRTSNMVFGMDLSACLGGPIHITEGVTDALAVIRCGLPCVAAFGSRLGMEQAAQIVAMRHEIVTMYDADKAGVYGTTEAIRTLAMFDTIPVDICFPPLEYDPEEAINAGLNFIHCRPEDFINRFWQTTDIPKYIDTFSSEQIRQDLRKRLSV